MNRFALALLTAFILVPAGHAQQQSGFIRNMGYRIDQKGKRSQLSVRSKIWFTTTSTRNELYETNILKHVSVDGDRRWSAYPRIKRFQRHDPTPWGFRSYPEEVKLFAERFAELKPAGRNQLVGYPCDKYSWHVKKVEEGCLPFPDYDVTCWAYRDETFPVSMRLETTLGDGSEIAEMKLNREVPVELFQEPSDFSLITPLTIPPNDFSIVIRERRSSDEYGWSEKKRHEFARDNKIIRYSCKTATTHSRGKESVHSSQKELNANEALIEISRHLPQPYWPGVVREGQKTWNGMTVDIYVPDSARKALEMKWWVLDHPELGTITIKKTEAPQNRVIEVERVIINDNMETDKNVEQ